MRGLATELIGNIVMVTISSTEGNKGLPEIERLDTIVITIHIKKLVIRMPHNFTVTVLILYVLLIVVILMWHHRLTYKIKRITNSNEFKQIRSTADGREREAPTGMQAELVIRGEANTKIIVNVSTNVVQSTADITTDCFVVKPLFTNGVTTIQINLSSAINKVVIVDISIDNINIRALV